ncbi:PiggyBac transposable element-derived protein, partial [Cinara cedri]
MTVIRKIFEDFVKNCKSCYKISEYATIDEKLQSFRGRCSFRVYMPNKPAKYGLKLFALVDSVNYYTNNLELYAGTQPLGPFSINNSASCVVKRLIENIKHTGRNITIDNWFTSITLADDILIDRITLI